MSSHATRQITKAFPALRNVLLSTASQKARELQAKMYKDGDDSGDDEQTDTFGFTLNSLIASLARLKDAGEAEDEGGDDDAQEKSADGIETLADVIEQLTTLSAAYDEKRDAYKKRKRA